ncbi:MAG: lactate utilization protein [Ruminococcus sp.]|uniref:lactate utilization protein n=1 Tax=Ruminococcus sp. TaxID=41978 RepID=UPI0025E95DDA|nr:lactate utilization protein [Ruminococcus sp.]MBR5683705.1 lactate utilization protein [Ruminococcus sp.]
MDENKKTIIEKRIRKTGENLVKNNMEFYYAKTKEDVCPIVESLLNDGDVITNGGTMTMKECGLADLFNSPKYKYLDRAKVNTPEEVVELYRKAFFADVYISSSNAITEDGVLYNVDGNSNRIAAIAFGPKSVIIIAGYNKIVKDLDEAEIRVKRDAAPPNCVRLDCATYCREKGECVSFGKAGRQITDGCSSDSRICCNYLISAHQRHKNRIKVIIVGEELGY